MADQRSIVSFCKQFIRERKYEYTGMESNIMKATKENGELFCIFLLNISQLNTESLLKCINLAHIKKTSHIVILYKNKITPKVNEIVNNISNIKKVKIINDTFNIEIELFLEYDFKFNLIGHNLQSLCEKVSKEELKTLNTDWINNTDHIKITDPIVKYYNLKKGDIIKTIQDGIIVYRVVK